VIAHRGASAEAPENTLAAIELAIEIGADACEFDVRATKDDSLVLMHDDTVNRTTDGKGKVLSKMTGELRALDAGRWFSPSFKRERIPTLVQALRRTVGRIVPIIEIKDDFDLAPWAAGTVVKALDTSGVGLDQAVVIARDLKHLRTLKAVSPGTPCAAVTLREKEVLQALDTDVDGAFAFWPSTSPKLTRTVRGVGNFFLVAWTLDSSHMKTVCRYGVDALVTNDPRSALDQVRSE
jgi:glycerophosphoryl diester phosphodiesterase